MSIGPGGGKRYAPGMNRAIAIRPATLADHAVLADIHWRTSIAVPEDRDHLIANASLVELPADHIEADCVFAAVMGAAAVGFGTVLPRADGDADIDAVFVEPDRWGEGIGRLLVAEAERRALNFRAARLHVIANRHALGFYRKLGFVADGPFKTRFGTGEAMHKTLNSQEK